MTRAEMLAMAYLSQADVSGLKGYADWAKQFEFLVKQFESILEGINGDYSDLNL